MGKGKGKDKREVSIALDGISRKEFGAFLRKQKAYHDEKKQKGESLEPPRHKSEQDVREYVSKWCPDGLIQDRFVAEIWQAVSAVPSTGQHKYPTYLEMISMVFVGEPEDAAQVTTLADGGMHISWTLRDDNNGKGAYKSGVYLNLKKGLDADDSALQRRQFFSSLSPHTEKVLDLLIKKSYYGKGNMCVVDMNNDLDQLGYARNKSNCHHSSNKRKYVEAIKSLSRITFFATVRDDGRKGTGKRKRKSMEWDFEGSLITIPFSKVNYRDADSGRIIKQYMVVRLQPLYELITRNLYTWLPDDITEIDIRKYPFARRIHGYINHQWALSYIKKRGCIRCSLRVILDKSGVFSKMPKRKDRRSKFIEYRLREFKHLVERGTWKSCRKVEDHHDPLDDVYEIILPDNHGLHLLD